MANKPGEANFFPDVPVYPEMGTFQPVYGKFDLTTYIQSASDYEIMAFLVGKYNACLEAYGNITKLSTDTITACKQLQDWINSWFTNLDVQEEINNKLDNMVADGSFGTLLHQTFDEQINQQTSSAVTKWLVANVTPTGSAVVVDKSLSIEGAAADAKATGTDIFYAETHNTAPYNDFVSDWNYQAIRSNTYKLHSEEIYNHNSTNILTTSNGSRLDKYRIYKNRLYTLINVYGYFTCIKYDDGTLEAVTDLTDNAFTTAFTAKNDGFIYISVHKDYKDTAYFYDGRTGAPESPYTGFDFIAIPSLHAPSAHTIVVGKADFYPYHKVVDALNYANSIKDDLPCNIYITSGYYDILEELGGQTFLNSITHDNGERQGLGIKRNKINIIGQGYVELQYLLPDTVTYEQSQCTSALNLMEYTCSIENLVIKAKNCRYAIHDEANGGNHEISHYAKNIRAIHYGNKEGLWEYPTVMGGGGAGGADYTWLDCQFITNTYSQAFSYHTNYNQVASHYNIDGCVGICNNSNGNSFRCSYYGTGQVGKTIFNFKNCSGNGKVVKQQEGAGSFTDHIEMFVNGWNTIDPIIAE